MFSEEFSQLESALREAGEPGRVLQLELLKQFGQFVQRLSSSLASEVPVEKPKEVPAEAEIAPPAPSTEVLLSGYGDATSLREVRGEALEVFDTRPLDAEDYVALWVDAIEVWGRKFLLCMGVTAQGRKHMLGVVEGREYDPAAAGQLLDDLVRRGLNASEGLLGITSGTAQLSRVLADYFGPKLKSQYCQMHKRQRVLSVLGVQDQIRIRGAITRAYACLEADEARSALMRVYEELQPLNRTAAQWLLRNLDQTLTLHRTGLYERLSPSLRSTRSLAHIALKLHRRLREVRQWIPAPERRGYLALLLLEIEAGLRRLPHAAQLPAMRSVLFEEDPESV